MSLPEYAEKRESVIFCEGYHAGALVEAAIG
jgi:hypothetical protein